MKQNRDIKPKGLPKKLYEEKKERIERDIRITCVVQECYDMLKSEQVEKTPAELLAVAIVASERIKMLYNDIRFEIRCRDNTFAMFPVKVQN